jgi:ABC-type Fe3+/spermidine/putrescine transport system ATPase subunit
VQIGPPEEIYSNPTTSFVAKFIGDTNLFEAEFKDRKAYISDTLAIRVDTHLPAGYISIRPQDITVSESNGGHANTFKGRVEGTQLNGISIDYIIKVNGINFRTTVLNIAKAHHNLKSGDDVYISFEDSSIKILAR